MKLVWEKDDIISIYNAGSGSRYGNMTCTSVDDKGYAIFEAFGANPEALNSGVDYVAVYPAIREAGVSLADRAGKIATALAAQEIIADDPTGVEHLDKYLYMKTGEFNTTSMENINFTYEVSTFVLSFDWTDTPAPTYVQLQDDDKTYKLTNDSRFTIDNEKGKAYFMVRPNTSTDSRKMTFTIGTDDMKKSKDATVSFSYLAGKTFRLSFNPYVPPVDGASTLNMGVGWNLGNTFDVDYVPGTDEWTVGLSREECWGNPLTTEQMIDAISAKGFKTLRVPITWHYDMESGAYGSYTIKQTFLDKIVKVVDYALENDMYVIINTHHDLPLIDAATENLERSKEALKAIWTQVATRFANYDNRLIFENFNEVRTEKSDNEWNGGTPEERNNINELHEVAIKAIRGVKGENETRYIMVAPYGASSLQVAIDGLDPLFSAHPNDNLIVSVHNYAPYHFCMATDTIVAWADVNKEELTDEIDRVYTKYVSNGIPVVMGEWGSINKGNTDDRVLHAEYYSSICKEKNICPVWWDNGAFELVNTGYDGYGGYGIFDRRYLSWKFDDIANAIVD